MDHKHGCGRWFFVPPPGIPPCLRAYCYYVSCSMSFFSPWADAVHRTDACPESAAVNGARSPLFISRRRRRLLRPCTKVKTEKVRLQSSRTTVSHLLRIIVDRCSRFFTALRPKSDDHGNRVPVER